MEERVFDVKVEIREGMMPDRRKTLLDSLKRIGFSDLKAPTPNTLLGKLTMRQVMEARRIPNVINLQTLTPKRP